MEELILLRKVVKESGLISDTDFFKKRKNRKLLYKSDPNSFLSVSKNGIPTFAIKNQHGGVSLSVLKRSLANAKRLHALNKDNKKYEDIINKIKIYMKSLEMKVLTFPRSYKLGGDLKKILNRSRDLGSLSNLGGLND